jgi:hypothetical protein
MVRGRGTGLLFLADLLLGLYCLNYGLNFINIPETFSPIGKWIVFLGGIFLIFAGIKSLMMRRYYY